jgi:hypothetical protein
MKHKIIYTNDYALIVSDEEIKEGDFNIPSDFDRTSDISITSEEDLEVVNDRFNGYKKIIAHRPLTDAPILEGVTLLPIIEYNVENLAKQEYPNGIDGTDRSAKVYRRVFVDGYNKAKETYKYTKEDLINAYERGMNNIDSDGCHIDQPSDDFNDFIQSLQQPKRPKYFESEMEKGYMLNDDGEPYGFPVHETGKPKTIVNSQCQTELIGEYSYE